MMMMIGGHSFEIGKKYKLAYNSINASANKNHDSDGNDDDDTRSKNEIVHDKEKVVLLQYTFKPVGLDPRGEGKITAGRSSEVKIRLPVLSDHSNHNNEERDAIAIDKNENDNDHWMSFKGTIATSEHTQSNEYILTVKSDNNLSKNSNNNDNDNNNDDNDDVCRFELSKVATVVSGIRHVRSGGAASVKRKQPEVLMEVPMEVHSEESNDNNENNLDIISHSKNENESDIPEKSTTIVKAKRKYTRATKTTE